MRRYLNLPPLEESAIKLLHDEPIPEGYPDYQDRYKGEGAIDDGPWYITEHPNRQHVPASELHHPDEPIDERTRYFWEHIGLQCDDLGRPYHPFAHQLIENKEFGMVTGPGWYWHFGPNEKIYAVLTRQCDELADKEVVVVRKPGKDMWSLPSAFVPLSRLAFKSVFDVLQNEVGLDAQRIKGTAMTSFPRMTLSRYDTLHAWLEENILAVREPNQGYLYAQELKPTTRIPAWRTIAKLEEDANNGRFPARFMDFIFRAEELVTFPRSPQ